MNKPHLFRCGYFTVFTCFLNVDRKGVEGSAHGPEPSITAVADSNPKRNMNVSLNTPAKTEYRRSSSVNTHSGTVSFVSDPYKLHPYSISLHILCPHMFIRPQSGRYPSKWCMYSMHLVFTVPEIQRDLFQSLSSLLCNILNGRILRSKYFWAFQFQTHVIRVHLST